MPEEIPGLGAGPGAGEDGGAGGGDGAAPGDGAEEIVDDGAGAGAGGDGTDAGGGTPDGTEGTEGGDGADGAGAGEGEDPDLETDGRKIDAKTKAAIAQLQKVDKVAAKAVKEAYFANQAVIKEFPDAKNMSDAIRAIRQTNAILDAAGGEAGIDELRTETADYRTEIEQFSNGDPKLIETLHESNPEGLAMSAANSLDVIASKSPKMLDPIVLPHLDRRLTEVGFDGALEKLANLIREGKGEEAYKTLQEIGQWRAQMKESAKKASEGRRNVDPREEKLAKDRQDLEKAKRDGYERNIGNSVTQMNNGEMKKYVEPLFSQLKLDPDGRREFVNGLQSRIWAAMKADKSFQKLAMALMNKGDSQKASRFIHQKFTDLLPQMFIKYRNSMYPHLSQIKKPVPARPANGAAPAAGTPAGKGGTPAKPAEVVVQGLSKKPAREEVDWDKTEDTEWIAGRAVLKNGKRIKFDWKAVPA